MLPPLLAKVIFDLMRFFCMFVGQEKIIHEMELRVKQQSMELEKANDLRRKVTQEKARLEIHIASLGADLQETNKRYFATSCQNSVHFIGLFKMCKIVENLLCSQAPLSKYL